MNKIVYTEVSAALQDCKLLDSHGPEMMQEAESLQQQNAVEEAALNSIVRERDQQQRQAKRATEQAQEVEQDLLHQLQQAAPQSAEHFRTLQVDTAHLSPDTNMEHPAPDVALWPKTGLDLQKHLGSHAWDSRPCKGFAVWPIGVHAFK